MTARETSRFGTGQTQHGDLDAFLAAPVTAGLNTISYSGRPLDLWIKPSPRATTAVVSFHPELPYAKTTRPYFVGAGRLQPTSSHKIYLADPTLELDDDLRTAWFAGNAEQRALQDDITRIIVHVLDGLRAEYAILTGPASGGYAALYYSARLPNTLAIAVNPHTDIFKCSPRDVSRYAKLAWKIHTREKAREAIPKRTTTNLMGVYSHDNGNTVILLEDANNVAAIKHHMLPMLEALWSEVNLGVLMGTTTGGDGQPSLRDLHPMLLEEAVKAAGQWDALWEEFPEIMEPVEALAEARSSI